jgi:DNA-directed RNA polymerase alpha subunit
MSKQKLPSVSNVEVSDIKYEITGIFKKHEREIKELLPTKKREIISFIIKNTTTAMANAIRRTLIEELRIKILNVEIEDIDTDEEFLIRDEFRDRLNLIPIDQSVNIDSTFIVDFVNTDTEQPWTRVYSKDVQGAPCDEKFSIAELRPGKHLLVSDIFVEEGYGYENAKFSPIAGIRYKPLDFTDVNMVNANGFFTRVMVRTADVLPAAKAKKSSTNEQNIHDLRILVIPDSSYKDQISETYKKKIPNYDLVVTKKIETVSSMNTSPETYLMEVETLGNLPAKQLIKRACDSIFDRLKTIHDELVPYKKDAEAEPGNTVRVEFTADVTKVHIYGETHTIGEILVKNVYNLDPAIPFVKKKLWHPLRRNITIEINHAEPVKIMIDACELGMDQIKAISKGF